MPGSSGIVDYRAQISRGNRIAMSEYLPEEVIIQILLRLPVKPLIQFTCVCRSWNSIIKHTSFINRHLNLNQNKTSNNTPSILLRHRPLEDPIVEQYSLHLDNDSFLEHSKPQVPVQSFNECFRVVGSCNGLLLLSDDYLTETNSFILWNPSIRRFVSLPKTHAPISSYSICGFGFDSKKNDYKVVKLVYLRQDGQGHACPEIELYSLNSGSWKTITATVPNYVIAQKFGSQVFVHGAVHWIASRRKENGLRNVILAFDVSDETFKEIELPEDLAFALPTKYMAISAAGKSIAVKPYDQNVHSIWIMREYGVVDSWTKKFSIDTHFIPNFRVVQIMGCRKNGEFLLEMYDHGRKTGELVSHDPNNSRNEFLGIHTDPGYSCIEYYTESLALLDRASELMRIP